MLYQFVNVVRITVFQERIIINNLKNFMSNQITNELIKSIKIIRQKVVICSFPNCKNKSILSHTISKGQLKVISENGIVYCIRRNILKHETKIIKNEGVQTFSRFYGFCKIHDNKIFEELDSIHMKYSNEKNINFNKICFLLLFRQVCHEINKKNSVPESITQTINTLKHNSIPVDSLFLDKFVEANNKGLYDLKCLLTFRNQLYNKPKPPNNSS